jgi:hypothetical protein
LKRVQLAISANYHLDQTLHRVQVRRPRRQDELVPPGRRHTVLVARPPRNASQRRRHGQYRPRGPLACICGRGIVVRSATATGPASVCADRQYPHSLLLGGEHGDSVHARPRETVQPLPRRRRSPRRSRG